MVCAKLPLWAGVAPLGGCLSAGGHAAGSALAAAGRNGGVSVCGVSTAGGIRVTNEALGDDLRCPVSLHLGAQHPGAPRASCRWLKHAAQGWCGAAIMPAGTGSRRWLLGWHRGTSRTQLQHPPPPCPRELCGCWTNWQTLGPPTPVPHQPWRGSRVQALSVPPRCFAGTQSSVESAVRFSTAGLWRASPARPCRGAVLFTALLAASVPGESVVMTCTANGEAMAVPCGLLRAGIVAAPVTPASPKCIYRAL